MLLVTPVISFEYNKKAGHGSGSGQSDDTIILGIVAYWHETHHENNVTTTATVGPPPRTTTNRAPWRTTNDKGWLEGDSPTIQSLRTPAAPLVTLSILGTPLPAAPFFLIQL
mmetsp:Transcript_29609/g.68929  ORF Transcript_29609/g.68929 Transcript_29609/m.68929 type:complete len:112 (+) Transcript_29609:106-441(+)